MDVNVMREQTCCFTGHRELPPQELDQIVEGLKTTIAALITKGIRYFGAGGALGFDVWQPEPSLTERSAAQVLRAKPISAEKKVKKIFQTAGNDKNRPAGRRPAGRFALYSLLYLHRIV